MDESPMKEIIESLTTAANVSLEDDDVDLIHPRYSQYKIKSTHYSQEEKRKQWLLSQKEKRLESINVRRGIEGDAETVEEEMELEFSNKNYYKKIVKGNRPYRDWIMMSEWMVDIPSDFYENWICTICPEGKRVLLIAEKGGTLAYSRRGDFIMKFPSALPGGHVDFARGHTIVDVIWHHPTKTFFLLDCLIWGVPVANCEARLRFYWLANKFAETSSLWTASETNRHRFALLPHNPVTQLGEMMAVHPPFENNFPKADGILFYHQESLYTGGKSPLVTWLKPFMVPHILNIPVAEQFTAEKPPNYPDTPKNKPAKPKDDSETSAVCSEVPAMSEEPSMSEVLSVSEEASMSKKRTMSDETVMSDELPVSDKSPVSKKPALSEDTEASEQVASEMDVETAQ